MRKSPKLTENKTFIWIIVAIFIIGIILFALYFPKKFHQQNSPIIPENFDNFYALMETPSENREKSVEEIIKMKDPTMVMFYANWCGHCQRAKPEFKKLQNELISQGSQIKAVLIDFDDPVGKKIARENGVQGFPTFKFYTDGVSGKRVIDYKGNRDVDGWSSFLKKHSN